MSQALKKNSANLKTFTANYLKEINPQATLDEVEAAYLYKRTILDNEFIPQAPTGRQKELLMRNDEREILFGGAAGGGKSSALLMAALQYVNYPNYAAILFRKTFKDLALPGALIDRSHEWLDDTAAVWNENNKIWTFPSGATVSFGYLESENDKYRYQSSEFQFVGFDELTQFSESQYRYLFSRLRRLQGSGIPIRTRSASNPGGTGHEWVKSRFISGNKTFVPSKLQDNPHVDQDEYRIGLAELDPLERRRLEEGDWTADQQGEFFRRDWFEIVDDYPQDAYLVRYWDLAATKPSKKKNPDPDETAGALLAKDKDGVYYIIDIQSLRDTPRVVERTVQNTAHADGKRTVVYMEQEPGSSGVNTIDHYQRRILSGFAFHGDRPTGPKPERARPLSSAAEAGNVKIVSGPWVRKFLDQASTFPLDGYKKDMIDACSGAFNMLNQKESKKYGVKPRMGGINRNKRG